jgi:23S rRNA (adenine2503-C2)-methyltransferase
MKDIKEETLENLTSTVVSWGEASFRAKQIHEWLWKKGAKNFESMTNIPSTTKALLSSTYAIHTPGIKQIQTSSDGTMKTAFELHDGLLVEGVIIPSKDRATACISSQVGCALGCSFCATGTLGFTRNLTAGEIYDQVVILDTLSREKNGYGLSNVVLMGMGEPLMNYHNVMRAIDYLTTTKGMGMSPQRITLSTAGIVDKIRMLADDGFKCNLAISLHTASNKKRDGMMKINLSNNLESLSEAISYFAMKTGTRVTLEYLMLNTLNDSIDDAAQLARFCKAFPCKINIIEYNSTSDAQFHKTTKERLQQFVSFLESRNMIVHVRASKGQDIDAACGQLVNKHKDR